MRILLRNKLKRRINTIAYCSIFTVTALVFTVSGFVSRDKVEYVIEPESSSYIVDVSGLVLDNVAAPASQKIEETTIEVTTTQEVTTEDLSGYTGIFMSNVSGNLNIRAAADMNSDLVGVLEEGNGGEVLQYGSEWTKIKSGQVTGYVATGYIAIGEKAEKIFAECGYIATVNTETLMVRAKRSKNGQILGMVGNGETFQCGEIFDKWVEITYEGRKAYLSKEFVKLGQEMTYAKTIDEIEAEQQAEAESIAAEQAAALAAAEAESRAAAEEASRAAAQQQAAAQQSNTSAQSYNDPDATQSAPVAASYDDAYLLACLVTCEAGNQSYEGKLAVANVVLNRVASSRFPNTISGVIYQSGQFGPAYTTLPGRLQSGPDAESQKAANAALAGTNIVPGYLSFGIVGTIDTSALNSYKTIGAHTFY